MKGKFFIFKCILIIIIFSHKIFARPIAKIDSLKIIPIASGNENVKLICYTTFSGGDCSLSSHIIHIQDTKISVTLNYNIGFLTFICHSVDTLDIPTLGTGNYELSSYVAVNFLNVISDSAKVNFTVGNILSNRMVEVQDGFSFYPNPILNEFQIKSNSELNFTCVEIYSATGNKVKQIKFDPDKKIHVPDLQAGLYFIVLTDNKGNRYKKKMIKNDL